MGETRQLAGLVIASLVIGLIGLFLVTAVPPLLEGNLVVDSYTATLSGNGTLHESYTYDVRTSGEYRMLYRSWEAPLVFDTGTRSCIQFLSVDPPPGTTGYAKDNSHTTVISGAPEGTSYKSQIAALAEANEVGIYNPSYFSAGKYTVGYTYIVHPPVEYDGVNDHLNLKLAGQSHPAYRHVTITIPAANVEQVYVYPPSLHSEKTGTVYTITGSVGENEIAAVEILATPGGLSGIPGLRSEVSDLAGKTSSASLWYNLPYYAANLLSLAAKVAVILVPFLFLYIYYRYGREKSYTVPEYMSTIPNPALKPWQVNLLFKDDAMDFDEDGYYATLLDLHRRKLIAITEKKGGKGIEIRVLSTATTDPYEQRVLS
ncbi:MAG: DUF2207 domain-containing protein, partial [Methanoregula sp.]|nr:DUF2207 domain-containing protein [Methanoregula sp.]